MKKNPCLCTYLFVFFWIVRKFLKNVGNLVLISLNTGSLFLGNRPSYQIQNQVLKPSTFLTSPDWLLNTVFLLKFQLIGAMSKMRHQKTFLKRYIELAII